VRLRALICVVAGHSWRPTDDDYDGVAYLRCRRCGRERVLSEETFEAEPWSERWMRQDMADELWIDPGTFDPRIQERRQQDRRRDL
jgi:hypothetical protein